MIQQECKKQVCTCNKSNMCKRCNECKNFHKVLSFVKVTDTSIVFKCTDSENISTNDKFCFVFPCKVNPTLINATCYFDINNKMYKLRGFNKEILSSDLKRRRLYKGEILENEVIELSHLTKF